MLSRGGNYKHENVPQAESPVENMLYSRWTNKTETKMTVT
jgi:hypothetical protein